MKRLSTILLLVLFCSVLNGWAQSSMSDAQIIAFVQKEQKAGTSQAQIVTKLMQKGVDVQRLQKLRKKYQGMQNGTSGSVKGEVYPMAEKSDTRLRKNNGDMKNSSQMLRPSKTKRKNTGLQNDDEEDEEDEYEKMQDPEYRAMKKEMNILYPDSVTEDEKFEEWLKEQKEKKKKKVFGRDIFNNKELTFEPNMNIATPQNYHLGPGDAVFIDVYGASQKTVEETISPDGTVTIEGYGPVHLSGLTVAQANARLRQTLGSRYASSKINLSVGQTRTIMVNVMGEVKTPGTYTLSAFATVFHALYMAGGINNIGTLRDIKVFRQGRQITSVDVYDYILNGNLGGNVRLTDNDVIVVGPYDCIVDITGKVKRPMYYEMKKNESMKSLLKYAGGFANDAYRQSVRVIRKNGRQKSVFNVTEFDMSSFHMADGDSVSVDSILNRYENTVELKGAVFRPGLYQLGGDITTVRSLLEHAEGPTEEAFTQHAVMHRMKKDRTLEVLSVDVQGILDGKVPDIPLRNEDVLFIPTKNIYLEEQTITIHGEVQYPGEYKYADNETLEDFIMQAGGLKESASVMKVDVARRDINPQATTTDSLLSMTYSFALKDGFVVDGQPGFKLKPFDQVYVRKSPAYMEQQNVTVEGNVLFPGTYTLRKRDTRLTDIIKAAGGPNDIAYVKGARLERKMTDDERLKLKSIITISRQNNVDAEVNDKEDSIQLKKLDVTETYYVGIELDKALAEPGSQYDIQLREGDKIIVPEYNPTVKINGAVMYPNTLAYVKGKSVRWYIKHGGGYATTAKKSGKYVIHQNGLVEKVDIHTKVTPGCEIVVPRKPKKKMDSAQSTSLIISASSTLATVGAVIVSAMK